MYTFSMKLFQPSWVNTAIYSQLEETYKLPSLETLLASIDQDVIWSCDPTTQAYYVDNLREANKGHMFQLHFNTTKDAREFTDLFMNVEGANVHSLALHFGSRGDRRCASRIIGWLKDITKKQQAAIDLEFEVAGVAERDEVRFIREHSLTAFQWHDTLTRYLHAVDDFRAVKEVKKGMLHYH